jgi:hypothetical protein
MLDILFKLLVWAVVALIIVFALIVQALGVIGTVLGWLNRK